MSSSSSSSELKTNSSEKCLKSESNEIPSDSQITGKDIIRSEDNTDVDRHNCRQNNATNNPINGFVVNGSDSVIYHEKQCRQMCAKHAINNLVQSEAFTKSDLDLICYNLSPNSRLLNPHKSAFGFGNYDINVIMSALHSIHLETIWFDKRKDPNCLDLENIKGFILNIPNPIYNSCKKWSARSLFALPTSLLSSRKHWIAIRCFGDLYHNLDSKLDFPEVIGNKTKLIDYLREKNSANDTEIFVIVSEPIAESLSWIRSQKDLSQA